MEVVKREFASKDWHSDCNNTVDESLQITVEC